MARLTCYSPSAALTSYYRRQAEFWRAQAEAQAERAARLQMSLCKALEVIELGEFGKLGEKGLDKGTD